MELAVFVSDLDRLPPRGEACDRVYLGCEFCHWRLPSPGDLERALREAGDRGARFSLVTPFLNESGLRRTLELVRELPADGPTELVVNDLGLLEAVGDAGWRGTLVAGRLLTRQRRGPGFQDPGDITPATRAALCGSALDSPPFVAWLAEAYGVRRFELDELAQGVAVAPLPEGTRLSLYRPWALVTATRNCPWIFDGRLWQREAGCPRPCRGRALRLSPAEGGRELTLGGCAQFLRIEERVAGIPPGVDRVVREPGIPA